MGEFNVMLVIFNVMLYGLVKFFLLVDDFLLLFGEFCLFLVFFFIFVFVQKFIYYYVIVVVFKVGWVLGFLEFFGNFVGLVRSLSQGVVDFFYLFYDGLICGLSVFVLGMF